MAVPRLPGACIVTTQLVGGVLGLGLIIAPALCGAQERIVASGAKVREIGW